MAEETEIQKKINKIFGDTDTYFLLKKKMLNIIYKHLRWHLKDNTLKGESFYEDNKIFEQYIDIFLEDIINHPVFYDSLLPKLWKLQRLLYDPRETYNTREFDFYMYRHENTEGRPMAVDLLDFSYNNGKSKTPEEEEKYKEDRKKSEEHDANHDLAMAYFSGKINSRDKKNIEKQLDEYLKSLITEEEAIDKINKEIEDCRKKMISKVDEIFVCPSFFHKGVYDINFVTNPVENMESLLDSLQLCDQIMKGINENREFIKVKKESNEYFSADDFEVTSEYIMIIPYDIMLSCKKSFFDIALEQSAAYPYRWTLHRIIIYIPSREIQEEYPQGTTLGDLLREKQNKEKRQESIEKFKNAFRKLLNSVDERNFSQIGEIVNDVLKEEIEEIEDNKGKE